MARPEDLATVRTTCSEATRGPGTRTDYVSARNVKWSRSVAYEQWDDAAWSCIEDEYACEDQEGDEHFFEGGAYASPVRYTFTPGTTSTAAFGFAPHSPQGVVGQRGDQLEITPSGWSDAKGHTYRSYGEDVTTKIKVTTTGGKGRSTVRLWWSSNSGATWRRATLANGVATVKAPSTADEIALRAEATDAAGNTAKETIRRAYFIR